MFQSPPLELDKIARPSPVKTVKKTATKRKNTDAPSCSSKKQAVSTSSQQANDQQTSPQQPRAILTMQGTLIPFEPAAANSATPVEETPSLAERPVAAAKPKKIGSKATRMKAICTTPASAQTASVTNPEPKSPEKTKSEFFKIFLSDDGKTCYLAYNSEKQNLTSEQMKTAQVIAFQTAQRLGCDVTEPPQIILIKSNNTDAVDKTLIPELENTKVFNVMFQADAKSDQEDGSQPKSKDQPLNQSESSPDENDSQKSDPTTTNTTELPNMSNPYDTDSTNKNNPTTNDTTEPSNESNQNHADSTNESEMTKSPEKSESSLSNSIADTDVQFVDEVDPSVPIVLSSDESDSESENDKCSKQTTSSPSSSMDVILDHSYVASFSPQTKIAPLQRVLKPVTKQYPPCSSTRVRPAATASTSNVLSGPSNPIIRPATPTTATGPVIPPNISPSFVTKLNEAGQPETFIVLQPGQNPVQAMLEQTVQLPNGQRGLISLPASVVQKMALTSAQAGRVPPLVQISKSPATKVITVHPPAKSKQPTAASAAKPTAVTVVKPPAVTVVKSKAVTVAKPTAAAIIQSPSRPIPSSIRSQGCRGAAISKPKPQPVVQTQPSTPDASTRASEIKRLMKFQSSVAEFVLAPWLKAIEAKINNPTNQNFCKISLFAAKALNETINLCEKLGVGPNNANLIDLQKKAVEINEGVRERSKDVVGLRVQIDRLRAEVTNLKNEKDDLKKKLKSQKEKTR